MAATTKTGGVFHFNVESST